MAARFTYSRWDGTQRGFELDADALFDELTDDLLYHGDVNSALRRMMQEGMRDRNGERLQGLRELMDKLRQQRQERLDQYDLGGVYNEIADELNDIVDEERHAIDNATQAAERSGDERRAQTARDAAADRNFRLDMLPDDLAGKVRELQAYDFESAEAAQRFEQLLDKLRQQLMQQMVDQMSGAMQNMTPEDMQRMKDMMAGAQRDAREARARRGPRVRAVHGAVRRLLPGEPADARRAARADGPADGGDAGDAQLDDARAAGPAAAAHRPAARGHGPALADDQLGQNLQAMFPQMGWDQSYDFEGRTRWAWARRCRRCRSSATSTSSRTCCAARPARARWPRPTWTRCATCSATTRPARWSASPS